MQKPIIPDAIVQPDSRTSRSDLVRKGHTRKPLFDRMADLARGSARPTPRSGEGRFR
jgi:hypothetical protein